MYRDDFPIFEKVSSRQPFYFLDSASSAQKPQVVLDAMTRFYQENYANIHRGIYELSAEASKQYESVRKLVCDFIRAEKAEEIIFVSGTTDAINLIANTYGRTNFRAGDEIILSEMEHHSNIVPWYLLKKELGIELKIIPVLENGELDLNVYQQLFSSRTQLVAVTHASNVLGTINPIEEMTRIAHAHAVPVLVDGAQAVAHIPVDVQALDCDFYAFSAHKMYGPTGVGVLYAKAALLQALPPYQGGGGMIETVSFDEVTFTKAPHRFEAGTPPIAEVIGLGAAIQYINNIGFNAIHRYETPLVTELDATLHELEGVQVIGQPKNKLGVTSFVLDHIHAHDVGTILDHAGVAIRAGHHCAMPLMQRFKVPATVRVSIGIYNTEVDIAALVLGLYEAKRIFSS